MIIPTHQLYRLSDDSPCAVSARAIGKLNCVLTESQADCLIKWLGFMPQHHSAVPSTKDRQGTELGYNKLIWLVARWNVILCPSSSATRRFKKNACVLDTGTRVGIITKP